MCSSDLDRSLKGCYIRGFGRASKREPKVRQPGEGSSRAQRTDEEIERLKEQNEMLATQLTQTREEMARVVEQQVADQLARAVAEFEQNRAAEIAEQQRKAKEKERKRKAFDKRMRQHMRDPANNPMPEDPTSSDED